MKSIRFGLLGCLIGLGVAQGVCLAEELVVDQEASSKVQLKEKLSRYGVESIDEVETDSGSTAKSSRQSLAGEGIRVLSRSTTGDCYTNWWVSGNTSWKWEGLKDLIFTAEKKGKSWTRYGSAEGPCDIELIVDQLDVQVVGHPKRVYGTHSKTKYNASSVDIKVTWSMVNVDTICGSSSTHTATKNGVTWQSTAHTGCKF